MCSKLCTDPTLQSKMHGCKEKCTIFYMRDRDKGEMKIINCFKNVKKRTSRNVQESSESLYKKIVSRNGFTGTRCQSYCDLR